jgi:hypothetical protein
MEQDPIRVISFRVISVRVTSYLSLPICISCGRLTVTPFAGAGSALQLLQCGSRQRLGWLESDDSDGWRAVTTKAAPRHDDHQGAWVDGSGELGS